MIKGYIMLGINKFFMLILIILFYYSNQIVISSNFESPTLQSAEESASEETSWFDTIVAKTIRGVLGTLLNFDEEADVSEE